MSWSKIGWSLFFTGFVFSGFSQNINPADNAIFVQNELTRIELSMSSADKNALVYPADPSQDIYYQATIHITNSKIDSIFGPVGVRIRGNTSRGNKKKSFKIDFKEFGGEQVQNLKKLNLKPNNNDPSMLRESLSWLMYREMNVPAARTAFAELYMNNEFMGVYQNIENIDDEFVNRRYGNEQGNLFKCTWGATLEKYNDVYNDKLFELKTNPAVNDRSRLEDFIAIINLTPNAEWERKLESIFNVDGYLRQMAVESLIGHWDGYSFNTNNYYLYDDPETGKFHFIPYDLDNTWGIDWIGPDWGNEDLLSWYSNQFKVPLTTQILKSSKYFDQYILYLNDVVDIMKDIDQSMERLFDVIHAKVAEDKYYSMDFGFTYHDFLVAKSEAWGKHVEYGIEEYIEERLISAHEQIPDFPSDVSMGEISQLHIYPNPANGFELNYSGVNQELFPEIYDTWGRRFPAELSAKGSLSFHHRLQKGLYFAKFGDIIQRFTVNY